MENMPPCNPLFSRRLPHIEPSIWSRSPLSIVSPSMTVIQAKPNEMVFATSAKERVAPLSQESITGQRVYFTLPLSLLSRE